MTIWYSYRETTIPRHSLGEAYTIAKNLCKEWRYEDGYSKLQESFLRMNPQHLNNMNMTTYQLNLCVDSLLRATY